MLRMGRRPVDEDPPPYLRTRTCSSCSRDPSWAVRGDSSSFITISLDAAQFLAFGAACRTVTPLADQLSDTFPWLFCHGALLALVWVGR